MSMVAHINPIFWTGTVRLCRMT